MQLLVYRFGYCSRILSGSTFGLLGEREVRDGSVPVHPYTLSSIILLVGHFASEHNPHPFDDRNAASQYPVHSKRLGRIGLFSVRLTPLRNFMGNTMEPLGW